MRIKNLRIGIISSGAFLILTISCKTYNRSATLQESMGASQYLTDCEENAKGFALMIGGPGYTMSPEKPWTLHMARTSAAEVLGLQKLGYCTTMLYGFEKEYSGFNEETFEPIKGDWIGKGELEELRQLGVADFTNQNHHASTENFARWLNEVKGKVRPGMKVVVTLAAHGSLSDAETDRHWSGGSATTWDGFVKDHFSSNDLTNKFCHTCSVAGNCSTQGDQPERLNLDDYVGDFAELEQKAEVMLLLRSCHSGGSKYRLSALKNTCVIFSASAKAPSHGCMESDPKGSIDYTATAYAFGAQLFGRDMGDLMRHSYFRDSQCMANLQNNHLPKVNTVFDRPVNEAYLTYRSLDKTWDESSTSDLVERFKYFQTGFYHGFWSRMPIDTANLDLALQDLFSKLGVTGNSNTQRLKSKLLKLAEDYNSQFEVLSAQGFDRMEYEMASRRSMGFYGSYKNDEEKAKDREFLNKAGPRYTELADTYFPKVMEIERQLIAEAFATSESWAQEKNNMSCNFSL